MRNRVDDAGIADQHIKTTELVDRDLHSRLNLGVAAHVARDGNGLHTDLLRECADCVPTPREKGHICPCGGKFAGGCSADSAACTCD